MKSKVIPFLLNNKFNLFVLVIYFLIVFVTMLNHEMWRDEAHVWINIHYNDFIELLKLARNVGHLPLWYTLLFPFERLNFSPVTMQICSFLFVFAGVCYFMFKAPFNKLFNVLFVFSAGMLYYLPIIARDYSLIPVILFMIAVSYKTRSEKPYRYVILLTLLSLTHSLMWGFCLICSVIFVCEKIAEYLKKKDFSILQPLSILFLNFFIISFFYIGLTKKNEFNLEVPFENMLPPYNVLNEFTHLKDIFSFDNISLILILLIILIIFILLILKNRKSALILACSFFYINFVLTSVWRGGIVYQKSFIYFLILLFCVWITISKDVISRYFNILLTLIFLILFLNPNNMPFNLVKNEINKTFSFAKETANYLKNNVSPEEGILFTGSNLSKEAILLYLPWNYKLYSTEDCNNVDSEEIEKYIEENSLDISWIVNYRYEEAPYLEKYELKYATDFNKMDIHVLDETFDIYYRNK